MAKELKEIRARVAARREELFDASLRLERARKRIEVVKALEVEAKAEYNSALAARSALLSAVDAEEASAIITYTDGEKVDRASPPNEAG